MKAPAYDESTPMRVDIDFEITSPGLYFGSFVATRECERIVRPMVIVIPDVGTSIDYVTELCFEQFPQKDGLHDHRASLDQVPQDLVEKAVAICRLVDDGRAVEVTK